MSRNSFSSSSVSYTHLEQLVLSLYYEKELNMKEIAQVMGVSAARVSQIHRRALQRLRTSMKQYLES